VRLDWEIAKRGYRRYAAYPAATFGGLFTNTVFGFLRGYVLLAIFRHRDVVGGYDATDTITYAWLGQGLIATVYIWGWHEFALRIRSGDIATDLTRPIHPLRYWLAFDLGRGLYHALFRGIPPILLGALVFHLTAPSDLLRWLAFVASVALAVAVSFAFRYLYNAVAFWTVDYRGPMMASMVVANLLSGFIVPIAFFPGWLKTIAHATPFPSMVQIPIDIFIGNASPAQLAVQAAWLAAMLGLCHAVTAAGTRRLVVQGG
jgi:viologen exporter family transport system permease protein